MKFSLVFIAFFFVKLLNVKIPRECKCTTLHLTADGPDRDCIGQNAKQPNKNGLLRMGKFSSGLQY